jgi:4-hydroxybenzoate polyprenyltransferase
MDKSESARTREYRRNLVTLILTIVTAIIAGMLEILVRGNVLHIVLMLLGVILVIIAIEKLVGINRVIDRLVDRFAANTRED